MKVAVEGCCHGQLDAIYGHIQRLESQKKYKVDLLLICGDFQATRDDRDLQTMAVPQKYKHMGDFHKYYTGQATAPILTVVIGGNHEASNHLWELYHGGWLAPNIYFLGHAGCVRVNGIRVAGASGIFKPNDYHRGHYERQPYDKSTMRSIYHIREFNVLRLSLLSSPDVFLSHDWPCGIEHHGDLDALLRRKPFFREDIMSNKLGSPPMMGLLRNLQPTWWFSAHLHTRFEARVRHDLPETTASSSSAPPSSSRSGPPPRVGNPDEITIDDIEEEDVKGVVEDSGVGTPSGDAMISTVAAPIPPPPPQNPDEITLEDEIEAVEPPPPLLPPPRETKFLALDKCLPHRQFLEVVDIPTPELEGGEGRPYEGVVLSYDPEWLAITRAFQPYLSLEHKPAIYPNADDARGAVSREWDWVHAHVPPKLNTVGGIGDDGDRWRVDACQRFIRPPSAGDTNADRRRHDRAKSDAALAQTEAFAALLEMENVIAR